MSTDGTLKYGLRPSVRLADNIAPFAADDEKLGRFL